jgi:hypothetical protein
MNRQYIGQVELRCVIDCWRSQQERLLAPSLVAADYWVRAKRCAHCGEALQVVDPVACEAIDGLEAAGLSAASVADGAPPSKIGTPG